MATSAVTVIASAATWWATIGWTWHGHRARDGHFIGSISAWQVCVFVGALLGCAVWAGARGQVFVPSVLAAAVVAVSFSRWSAAYPVDSGGLIYVGLLLATIATLVGFLCVAAAVDLIRVRTQKVRPVPPG